MRFSFLTLKFSRKFISASIVTIFVLTTILSPQSISAQLTSSVFNLPVPGTMVDLSARYTPANIVGITIYPENPFEFDFIIDAGEEKLQAQELRQTSQRLINYFLATLIVPEDEMWVNLSPYEKDRIIADGLSVTEMGRDMLAQDYMLKQLTASLMYPEEQVGSEFWDRIYAKTQAQFGTTEIPTNTFNKIWIVPDEASIYVNGKNVFINGSHLKVYLEEDYLALEKSQNGNADGLSRVAKNDIDILSEDAKELIREIIIPEIERDVNEGKNFANLRQIYNSMILATWYKKNLKDSVFGKIYADTNKMDGIDLEDKQIKEKIYNQYVEAFQKGVYDYIKEDYDSTTQEVILRKYFSGGLEKIASSTIATAAKPSQRLVETFSDAGAEFIVNSKLNPTDGKNILSASSVVGQNILRPVSEQDKSQVDALVRYFQLDSQNMELMGFSRNLMSDKQVEDGGLIGRYLTRGPQAIPIIYRIGVSEAPEDFVSFHIDGDDLIIVSEIGGVQHEKKYLPDVRQTHPFAETVFQAIRANERGAIPAGVNKLRIKKMPNEGPETATGSNDSESRPQLRIKRIADAPKPASNASPEIRRELEAPIDFTRFYAGERYEEQVLRLLRRHWENFSIRNLAHFIEQQGVESIHTYSAVDELSRAKGKRIFRIFPPKIIRSNLATHIVNNIPSLAVLWNENTNQVERIAVHLDPAIHNGRFVELAPGMDGFEELKTILTLVVPENNDKQKTISDVGFTWPFVEEEPADFEVAILENEYLRFVFGQILKQNSQNPTININRGFWSIRYSNEGGDAPRLEMGDGETLKSLGKEAFSTPDYGILFHEQLHDLFYLMVETGKLSQDGFAELFKHIVEKHPRFARYLLTQLPYQNTKNREEQFVSVVTEWISYTSQAVFMQAQTNSIEERENFSISSRWGNNITYADIQLLRRVGFLPKGNSSTSSPLQNPGGIDFNPNNLNLSQQGQSIEFIMDNSFLETFQPEMIHGIQPVIINISPVTNYLPLLGLSRQPEEQQLSQL